MSDLSAFLTQDDPAKRRKSEWAKAHIDYLRTTQLAIVSRFQEAFRYVSLRRENASTFSYEFASILRDAGSAFGSFSDAVVRGADPSKSWGRNSPHIEEFFDFYSQYASNDLPRGYIEVEIVAGPRRLQPFWGWSHKQKPLWWEAYNKVKHSEYVNAKEGNLRNATNAVAAVEIVLSRASGSRKGTELFTSYGRGPWKPGESGIIERLFDP